MSAVAAPIANPAADLEPVLALTAKDMARVDALILDRMQSEVEIIPALARHLISAGGKRLRPMVTVAAARACGTGNDNHLKLAAAVEFIHAATLLHDDIVDGSSLRRGKPAAHLIWGAASSVLVGDFLFTRSFELMVETGSLKALRSLARASSVIAEGEVLQLTRAHDIELPREVYLEIIGAKTAELFAAAAESGAIAAVAPPERVRALRDYGRHLGLAFQLVDDALDYEAEAAALGKNAGDDFREGKVTLPLLLAIAATPEEGEFWRRTIQRREQTEEDFARAKALLDQTGAVAATLDEARAHAEAAKAALLGFDGPWRSALERLADFSVARGS
ncbi:polyprenyl synthetase family protein [Brevundimonas sp. 2R-24]|uniref:Polyprenyl synthetase family protein n=1 Tax=Peiella sedimenti TaxID=3061083 RepID=A0ABT8SI19_9CAUL|nr:polyprenyl synthetase family protein [Caulobacteraceae bacterium XZ-24]